MLVDSYAWIEYLIGSDKGKRVKEIVTVDECFTSIISIAEIAEWCLKNSKDIKERIKFVEAQSSILNIDEKTSILAAKINFERKKKVAGWGMIDSIILATSLVYGMKVLTGDRHFSDMENAVML